MSLSVFSVRCLPFRVPRDVAFLPSIFIRPGDDDGGARRIQGGARRADVVDRDGPEQIRKPTVVVEAETEEFRVLKEIRDAGVGLEPPRHRVDEILSQVVELLRRNTLT